MFKNKIKFVAIYVDIYENSYPVVRHIFYGKTFHEAERYERAHMQTDEFLRCAMTKGYFNDFPVRVKRFVRVFSSIPEK